MQPALGVDFGGLAVLGVDGLHVAHDAAKTLVLGFPLVGVGTVLHEGLEAALRPFVGVSGLLTVSAANIAVEVGAVVVERLEECGVGCGGSQNRSEIFHT